MWFTSPLSFILSFCWWPQNCFYIGRVHSWCFLSCILNVVNMTIATYNVSEQGWYTCDTHCLPTCSTSTLLHLVENKGNLHFVKARVYPVLYCVSGYQTVLWHLQHQHCHHRGLVSLDTDSSQAYKQKQLHLLIQLDYFISPGFVVEYWRSLPVPSPSE